MLRKRENKNYHSVSFLPDVAEKIPKNSKNIRKLKNTITATFQGKIGWKTLIKGENKNYRYVSFLPDGQEKIPKNSEKIEKYHYGFIPSQNWWENAEKERI